MVDERIVPACCTSLFASLSIILPISLLFLPIVVPNMANLVGDVKTGIKNGNIAILCQ